MKRLDVAMAGLVAGSVLLASPLAAQQGQESSGPKAPNAADKTLGPAIMGAYIAEAGGVTRGFGAVSSSRPNVGRYEVLFDRDVTQCVYSANISLTFNYVIVVDSLVDAPNGVVVKIFTATDGVLANVPFYLTVICGR